MKNLFAVPVLTFAFTGGVFGVARLFEERRGVDTENNHVSELFFHESSGLKRTVVLEGGTYVIEEEVVGDARRRTLDQGDWRRTGSVFEGRSIHGDLVRGAFRVTPSGGDALTIEGTEYVQLVPFDCY